MKNVFKLNNTVDGIVSTLTKTVAKLDKLRDAKLEEAEISQIMIDGMTELRNEQLAEAERAKKIATNVKKLLDIS